MKGLENIMLTVLQKRPLSSKETDLAKRFSSSEEPFERFIGRLAMQIEKRYHKGESALDLIDDQYAQEMLFRLFHVRSSVISNNSKIKKFVFRAASSKRVPTRINATQVLAKIATRERTAYTLLKKLRNDESEMVRHNAHIFLKKLSPKDSALTPGYRRARAHLTSI